LTADKDDYLKRSLMERVQYEERLKKSVKDREEAEIKEMLD
jgi:hypothetical protein